MLHAQVLDFAHYVLMQLQLQLGLCVEFRLQQEQQLSHLHSLLVIIAQLLTPICSLQQIVGYSQE